MRWYSLFLLLLLCTAQAFAQGAIDGYLKSKGEKDLAFTYSYEHFDEYYFGNELRDQAQTTQSMSFFGAFGWREGVNFIVAVPYIRIDEVNRGFQDATLAIKYRNERKSFKNGTLDIITSVGLSFPTSNYITDTTTPIGAKQVGFQPRLTAQYQDNSGFFIMAQSGLDLRLIPTWQTSIPFIARAGWASSKVYIDFWIDNLTTFNAGVDTSTSGVSGSNWFKIGGTVYVPVAKKFGVFVSGARFLGGTNIGLSTRVNGGFVYKLAKRSD